MTTKSVQFAVCWTLSFYCAGQHSVSVFILLPTTRHQCGLQQEVTCLSEHAECCSCIIVSGRAAPLVFAMIKTVHSADKLSLELYMCCTGNTTVEINIWSAQNKGKRRASIRANPPWALWHHSQWRWRREELLLYAMISLWRSLERPVCLSSYTIPPLLLLCACRNVELFLRETAACKHASNVDMQNQIVWDRRGQPAAQKTKMIMF